MVVECSRTPDRTSVSLAVLTLCICASVSSHEFLPLSLSSVKDVSLIGLRDSSLKVIFTTIYFQIWSHSKASGYKILTFFLMGANGTHNLTHNPRKWLIFFSKGKLPFLCMQACFFRPRIYSVSLLFQNSHFKNLDMALYPSGRCFSLTALFFFLSSAVSV